MRIKESVRMRIMELCEQNDLTVNALARHSGITQSTLNNITRGRNNSTTVATVQKLCDGLNITLLEFFDSELFQNIEQEVI